MKHFITAVFCLALISSPVCGQQTVRVADFGAVGDGLTDDTAAIRSAIQAAGPGGVVVFGSARNRVIRDPNSPFSVGFSPKVYLCSDKLVPLSNQIFAGHHSVIKRAAPVYSTLVSDAPAGSTVIEVAEPEKFKLYMNVTPVKGSGGQSGTEVGAKRIYAINGNFLTLSHPLTKSYLAGDEVVHTYYQIDMSLDSNASIRHFNFDGNRLQQRLVVWSRNGATKIRGVGEVTGSTFQELSGNACDVADVGAIFTRNRVFNTDAAALHFSHSELEPGEIVVTNNMFWKTNQLAGLAGHSEGVLTISANNNHLTVENNLAAFCSRPFIGQFHVKMQDWSVRNNRVISTGGLFQSKNNNNGSDPLSMIDFQSNFAVNVGHSKMKVLFTATDLGFSGNEVIGGSIEYEDVDGLLIADNVIQSSTAAPMILTDIQNLTESNNVMAGGVDFAPAHNVRLTQDSQSGEYFIVSDGDPLRYVVLVANAPAFHRYPDLTAYGDSRLNSQVIEIKITQNGVTQIPLGNVVRPDQIGNLNSAITGSLFLNDENKFGEITID